MLGSSFPHDPEKDDAGEKEEEEEISGFDNSSDFSAAFECRTETDTESDVEQNRLAGKSKDGYYRHNVIFA